MNEPVAVHENGISERITKQQAAAQQLANKAAKGDLASLKIFIQLLTGVPHLSPPPKPVEDGQSAREKLIEMLNRIAERRVKA